MDGTGRHPGARAKMSGMRGGVHRTWNRNRALGVNRSVPSDAACDPVRGIAVVPCGRTRAPLRRGREAVISAYSEKGRRICLGAHPFVRCIFEIETKGSPERQYEHADNKIRIPAVIPGRAMG
jgi:hypothetical protein